MVAENLLLLCPAFQTASRSKLAPSSCHHGKPIFEPESEQDEQSNRDFCRHDRPSRRRLDLARNPFRVPPNISPSDRRRAQVTRTSYRGDTLTIRGEICFSYSINKQLALSCQYAAHFFHAVYAANHIFKVLHVSRSFSCTL